MKIKTLSKWGAILAIGLSVSAMQANALPTKGAAAGDSITMGFGASCTGNVLPWDLLCLLGGDQPQHSWFDGWSNNVDSVIEKYQRLKDPSIVGNKNAAQSGTEMVGSGRNFAAQAALIVAQTPKPDHVEVELGGNDICNRGCVDGANCSNPLYSEDQWRSAVKAGLDTLVAGLPEGSTVYLGGVPRIQSLRAAGIAKQSSWLINCESIWSSYGICSIGTSGGTLNGETLSERLAGITARQQRYNEILKQEASRYNRNTSGQNPRGIEVKSNYNREDRTNTGTFVFGKEHIDGGDCFHPSFAGQNKLAQLMWNRNPNRN